MIDRSGVAAPPTERFIAGRYRIEAMIGQGGMGEVYAAVDTATGRRVALKRTLRSASAKVLELFKREFHTLHGLRHPNIIEVYDFGTDVDALFYTMELLEGADLATAAPMPWRRVCSYLRQVATLLGILHARRLLHRDLTPRNLWLLPDGRLKLIDFGALGPFGVPTEVVGTPPFVAPEWLYDREAGIAVDQRADLFALGALAYWLLTRTHAFPAASFQELRRAWLSEPTPPSVLMRAAENSAAGAIPPELDALVLALLRRDPSARPSSTERVIDRIDAIAGPPAEPSNHAVRGFVHSKAFVGRALELELLQHALAKTPRSGAAIVIEGARGSGRSRLLEEMSVLARLSGATSVRVSGDDRTRAFSVANDIALAVLEALPAEALAAAAPLAPVLARLSSDVQSGLGVSGRVTPDRTTRGREQLQQALAGWLVELARDRTLAILIDDLQRSDEESAAWLASLARSCHEHRLVLVAAIAGELDAHAPVHLRMLREAAQVVELQPLTAEETHALLQSVFGPATYLARVADTLYRASQGNPAHCLELVEFVIDRGLARYAEGTWILPGQLTADELPQTRSEMHAARLAQVGVDARNLAELMSLHGARLTLPSCIALSEAGDSDTRQALVDLTLGGILNETEEGYGFVHASVRQKLAADVTPERRLRAHERLGAACLATAVDPIDGLRAAVHLFRAGDSARCELLVREASRYFFDGNRTRLQVAIPLFEEIVQLYRAAGRGPRTLCVPLATLASASFFADRRLADRYGEAAIDALEQTLRFDLARSLSRNLGPKLALFTALGVAAASRRRREPKVADALRLLLGTAVALIAVATSGFDVSLADRCCRALEPLGVLGPASVPGFVRRCALAVAAILTENYGATLEEQRALRRLLEGDLSHLGLPEHLLREFLGGCLFAIGIMESWKQSSAALEIADRIEPFSPMYALDADHLRALYYSGRGETSRAEYYRQRVETRALQVGAAWQVVTLGPINAHVTALWTQDPALAKQAAAELERLSRELPALRHEARSARATYLVLSDRPREAIEAVSGEVPQNHSGRSRGLAVLARAYNRLGEHARARELCEAALVGRSEADLSFVVMFLHAEIERVIADAALGDRARAVERLEQLFARHGSTAGPLALGALHETRVGLALMNRDVPAAMRALVDLRACYEPIGLASLLDVLVRLERRLAELTAGSAPAAVGTTLAEDEERARQVHATLEPIDDFELRAKRALEIVVQWTGARDGFMILPRALRGIVGSNDVYPSAEVVRWARSQLDADTQDETAVMTDADETLWSPTSKSTEDASYVVQPLSRAVQPSDAGAAVVLGFQPARVRRLGTRVLEALADHLR